VILKLLLLKQIKAMTRTIEGFILRNKPYISKSGDKLLIIFNGKHMDLMPRSILLQLQNRREKFAAMVVESTLVNEDESKKMEEGYQKCKKPTRRRWILSMKYAQEMQQKMMKAGGTTGILPKLITKHS